MNHLTPYRIFEYISNIRYVQYYVDQMLVEFEEFGVKKKKVRMGDHDYSYIDLETVRPITKILKKYKEKFSKMGMILSYREIKGSDNHHHYDIYVKNHYTVRYYPGDRYLYHCSPEKNRDDIAKEGIKKKNFEESDRWSHMRSLAYPDAVFATTGVRYLWSRTDDVWLIDGSYSAVKWQTDLNFDPHSEKENGVPRYVMTYSDIPPDRIILFDGTYESHIRLYVRGLERKEDVHTVTYIRKSRPAIVFDKRTGTLSLNDSKFWNCLKEEFSEMGYAYDLKVTMTKLLSLYIDKIQFG